LNGTVTVNNVKMAVPDLKVLSHSLPGGI